MKRQIIRTFTFPRVLAALILLLLVSASSMAGAQTVLQGYNSDEKLQKGMLVALKKEDQSKIVAVTNDTLSDMKGVIADANDSPVTLGAEGQKYFVATEGTYEVLVSNENGKISKGDYISVSSLSGIGMKAVLSQNFVIGRATGNFEGGGDSIGRTATKDNKTVEFGRMKVDLGLTKNPYAKSAEKAKVPDALQKIANGVAEKSVPVIRIYIALTVLILSAGVAAVTLFSGVRSTVISIGRNPLSKGIILKGLVQVLLVSLIIFITGLFGVYLLLKL